MIIFLVIYCKLLRVIIFVHIYLTTILNRGELLSGKIGEYEATELSRRIRFAAMIDLYYNHKNEVCLKVDFRHTSFYSILYF